MGGGGRTVSTSNRRPVFLLLVLGLAMLVFALLQLNDPDPEVWVGYYAVMACACTVAAYRPLPAVLFWALAAASVAGAALTVPGFVDWVLNRPASDLWGPCHPTGCTSSTAASSWVW